MTQGTVQENLEVREELAVAMDVDASTDVVVPTRRRQVSDHQDEHVALDDEADLEVGGGGGAEKDATRRAQVNSRKTSTAVIKLMPSPSLGMAIVPPQSVLAQRNRKEASDDRKGNSNDELDNLPSYTSSSLSEGESNRSGIDNAKEEECAVAAASSRPGAHFTAGLPIDSKPSPGRSRTVAQVELKPSSSLGAGNWTPDAAAVALATPTPNHPRPGAFPEPGTPPSMKERSKPPQNNEKYKSANPQLGADSEAAGRWSEVVANRERGAAQSDLSRSDGISDCIITLVHRSRDSKREGGGDSMLPGAHCATSTAISQSKSLHNKSRHTSSPKTNKVHLSSAREKLSVLQNSCDQKTPMFEAENSSDNNPADEDYCPAPSMSAAPGVYRSREDDGEAEIDVENSIDTNPASAAARQPPSRTDSELDDNLIQAELVQERSELDLVVQAVEVDPNATDAKPIYQHRQFRHMAVGIGCFCVIIIIVVAVVASGAAGGGGTTDSITGPTLTPTAAPTGAPTDVSENEAVIKEQVTRWLQDPSKLNNASSPYYKALRWIVYKDQSEPDDDRLQERYLLASFYFATSVDHPWLACNPAKDDDDPVLCQHQQYDRHRREHVNVTSNRWLSIAHECDWAGVRCHGDDKSLKGIKLIDYEMSGTLIPELGLMPRLGEIDVRTNRNLGGPIPSTLGLLQNMHKLWLSNSGFSGTLPTEICNASGLKEFQVPNNFLTGTIPSCLGGLSLLEELALETNELTGTIPSELGMLENLEDLELDENKLSGQVPEEVCLMELDKLKIDCGEEDEYYVACDPSCGCEC